MGQALGLTLISREAETEAAFPEFRITRAEKANSDGRMEGTLENNTGINKHWPGQEQQREPCRKGSEPPLPPHPRPSYLDLGW